jgi:hypothetical protein
MDLEKLVCIICFAFLDIFGPILPNTDSSGNDIHISEFSYVHNSDDKNSFTDGQVHIPNVESIEICGQHCLKEARCVGVVYNSNRHCYLKHAMVARAKRDGSSSMLVVNCDRYH